MGGHRSGAAIRAEPLKFSLSSRAKTALGFDCGPISLRLRHKREGSLPLVSAYYSRCFRDVRHADPGRRLLHPGRQGNCQEAGGKFAKKAFCAPPTRYRDKKSGRLPNAARLAPFQPRPPPVIRIIPMLRTMTLIMTATTLFAANGALAHSHRSYGYQGGHYSGGHGSSHRGGHYRNARTHNHYTHHRPGG